LCGKFQPIDYNSLPEISGPAEFFIEASDILEAIACLIAVFGCNPLQHPFLLINIVLGFGLTVFSWLKRLCLVKGNCKKFLDDYTCKPENRVLACGDKGYATLN